MFPGFLRFEWRYHTRRVGFAAAGVVLVLLAATLVGTGYGPANIDVNSPYTITQSLGLLSLGSVFVLVFFCADAALRDIEHGMSELVFATPVGKLHYLGGRFAGALIAGLAVMAIATITLMLAPFLMAVEPERVGALRPGAYLWAFLLLVVPNLLLAGALLFAVAALARSTLATYVGAIAIYAGYLVTAMLVDSPLMAGTAPPTPEGLARAALLDPFGLSAFFEATRYWTPLQRETRLVELSGRLLLNRVLWTLVAAAVFALTYWRVALDVGSRRAPGLRRRVDSTPAPSAVYRPVTTDPASTRALLLSLLSATRLELQHVLRGWTFAALMLIWTFVAAMEAVGELSGGEYGTRVLATTGLMLEAARLPLLLVGTITIVYYAAEIAWRERAAGIDPLVDATPASGAVFYFSKLAALCTLPIIMALAGIVVGMLVQLLHGQAPRPALHLSLLWFGGVPLMLFACGALAMQALSGNRWLGMLGGLLLALVARRGDAIGLEHPMLHFGAGPAAPYSDIDAFGGVGASFAAFVGYWGAAAALLACLSWGLWRRGRDSTLRQRVADLRANWGRTGARAAVVCATLFAAAASLLFWQTTVVHVWESRADGERWRADYERAYRGLTTMAMPSVVAVTANIALFPRERRAMIEGELTLENRALRAMDSLWIALPREMDDPAVRIAGARLARRDARFGMLLFALDAPLAPGSRIALHFAGALRRGGIRAGGIQHDITGNGTVLWSSDVLPAIGYRAGYELSDPAARRAQGLAGEATTLMPLAQAHALSQRHDATAESAALNEPWRALDITVSTDTIQTALSPGRLDRTWTEGARRHFRYVSDGPVTPRFAVVSARLAVERTTARTATGDVALEVWYHPAHHANVARITKAAERSLEVLAPRFGGYPHAVLRVVEVPMWAGFGAFALPTMVLFPENRGFLSDPRAEEVDLVTRRVAHEVAHQWWGHRVDPADAAGSLLITETLAKHAEAVVVETLHGREALSRMLAFDEDRYLAGRAEEARTEPPLLETVGQSYLYYGKGAVVMHGLRDLLGEPAMDTAIARLLARHGGPAGTATSLDLLGELHGVARNGADSARVSEWLAERVLHDFRVDTAVAAGEGTGFRVTASVRASKTIGNEEAPVAFDGETIDVALYDAEPGVGRVLYAGKHAVKGGRIELSVAVPVRPAFIVVDPWIRRVDRDRSDNRRRVVLR